MNKINGIMASALIVLLLALPLALRLVPRNALYGFRTKQSMNSSEEEWFRLNRIAGIGLCISGLVTLITCLFVLYGGHWQAEGYLLCVGVFLASLMIAVFVTLAKQSR